MLLKSQILRFCSLCALLLMYPFLSHRSSFWWRKVFNLAYTTRNKAKFRKIGETVLLSSDLILRGPEMIEIGDRTSVGRGCSITAWRNELGGKDTSVLTIGSDTSVGEGAHITAAYKIKIGNGVLFGKYITVSDNNHGDLALTDIKTRPALRQLVSKGPVVIEDNVWIGDKATILGGVTVGSGAIVGANAVVTSDVPPASVVAGAPARVIKYFT